MSLVYLAVRLFPVFAIPIAFLSFEVGRTYRRKGSVLQWSFFSLSGFLIVFSLLWVGFRGDLHSDQWVRQIFGTH